VLVVLRPPALLRLALATLRLSLALPGRADCRVFGATMTSASGEIFTKAWPPDGAGVSDVTTTFAVDVGVKCSVSGCEWPAAGFGRARTWDRKFISRKWAWSSMTTISLSVAVHSVNSLVE